MKLCFAIVASMLVLSAPAHAQDSREQPDASGPSEAGDNDAPDVGRRPNQSDIVGARFLFRQGLELVEQEDWSRAAARFRSAIELRPSPAIIYNLAAALFELGQLNEAEELVVSLHHDEETPEGFREKAWQLAGRIPAAGGEISIRVDGADQGVQVYLDDRQLPEARLGVAMTASLGAHVVHVRRDGEFVAREDVTVSRDERADVVLLTGGGSAPSTGDIAVVATGPDEGDDSSLLGDWRFWAVAGGGVLLVGIVILIAVVASGGGTEAPIVGNFQPGVLRWE